MKFRILFICILCYFFEIYGQNAQFPYSIDNIQLGETQEQFQNKMLLSNPTGKKVFTIPLIRAEFSADDINILADYSIELYTTDKFDFTDNLHLKHYGFLFPQFINSTKKLSSLTIFLGYGAQIQDFANTMNITKQYGIEGLNQNMKIEYINTIEQMLIEKYGKNYQVKVIKEEYFPLYDIINKQYINNQVVNGRILIWKNEDYKIEFFEGIDDKRVIYKESEVFGSGYWTKFDENSDLSGNEEVTRKYAFIKFELTPEFIRKNKLNISPF